MRVHPFLQEIDKVNIITNIVGDKVRACAKGQLWPVRAILNHCGL